MNGSPTPARVVQWEADGVVYLASVPRGPIVAVRDTAMIIWRALGDGDLPGTAERVAETIGVDIELVRGEVDAFIAQLRDAGLIPSD